VFEIIIYIIIAITLVSTCFEGYRLHKANQTQQRTLQLNTAYKSISQLNSILTHEANLIISPLCSRVCLVRISHAYQLINRFQNSPKNLEQLQNTRNRISDLLPNDAFDYIALPIPKTVAELNVNISLIGSLILTLKKASADELLQRESFLKEAKELRELAFRFKLQLSINQAEDSVANGRLTMATTQYQKALQTIASHNEVTEKTKRDEAKIHLALEQLEIAIQQENFELIDCNEEGANKYTQHNKTDLDNVDLLFNNQKAYIEH
jgi:hypothetical protein